MAGWEDVHFQGWALMANEIQIDLSEWNKFALNLEKSGKLLDKHMRNAMDGSLDMLIDWIASQTPVNMGALRGSFASEIYGEAFGMTGIVASPLVYGPPVEYGRKAGRMPPVDAIKLWVVRKLQISGDEADNAAWAIARHIGAHGTEGAFMVTQAYNRAIGGTEIDQIWAYELEQFIGALTK
jgi:hypothetical protein